MSESVLWKSCKWMRTSSNKWKVGSQRLGKTKECFARGKNESLSPTVKGWKSQKKNNKAYENQERNKLSQRGNSILWLKRKKISKIRWNKNQEREISHPLSSIPIYWNIWRNRCTLHTIVQSHILGTRWLFQLWD